MHEGEKGKSGKKRETAPRNEERNETGSILYKYKGDQVTG